MILKWEIDYTESSILKKNLLRGKEMAVWHAVQLILTFFMKGFKHSLYVHISVSNSPFDAGCDATFSIT